MISNEYNAFISYRHQSPDQEIAKRLHTLIENYHIPSFLKKTLGINKMGRVFRDQEELPLSSDLGEDIRTALRNSEWLICICSPRYLESKWCLEELEYFISLGRRDRILAILVEGEPTDSFPYSLRFETISGKEVEREPLAADVRALTVNDSLKKLNNEKLRILAPMLGVNYDDLKQRDRSRKSRITFTVAASVILLLATFLTYVVIKNKQISNERNSALIAESKWLAQSANEALRNGNKNLSLLLSLEALPEDGGNPDRPIVTEAVSSLYNALIYGANDQYSAIYDIKVPYRDYIGLMDYLAIRNGEEVLFYNKKDGALYPDGTEEDLMYRTSFDIKSNVDAAENAYDELSEEKKITIGLDTYLWVHNAYRGENELAPKKAYDTIYLATNSRGIVYLYDSKLLRHTYSVDFSKYRDNGYFNYKWDYQNTVSEESASHLDSTSDGNYIVAVYEPYIVIWDSASEEVNNILFYPDFDKGFFKTINAAPQKPVLGILSVSGNVFTYDIDNKKTICRMDNKSVPLSGFCFNSDGTKILGYSADRKQIMLFSAYTGELLQQFSVDFNLEGVQFFCKDGYGNAVRDDYILACGKDIFRIYIAGNSSSLDVITPLKETGIRTDDNYSALSPGGETVFTHTTTTSHENYLCINDAISGEVIARKELPVFINHIKGLGHNEVFVYGSNCLNKNVDNEFAVADIYDGESGQFKENLIFTPDFNSEGKVKRGMNTTECKDVLYSKETDSIIFLTGDYYRNNIDSLFVHDGKNHELLWKLSGKFSEHDFDFEEAEEDIVALGYQLINDKDLLIVYNCVMMDETRKFVDVTKTAIEIRDIRTGQCEVSYMLDIDYNVRVDREKNYFIDAENGLLYTLNPKWGDEKASGTYDLYTGDLKKTISSEEYTERYSTGFMNEEYWMFGERRVRAKNNTVYDIDSGETLLESPNNIKILSSSENGEALEIINDDVDYGYSDSCYVVHSTDLNKMILAAKEMLGDRKLSEEERSKYFLK